MIDDSTGKASCKLSFFDKAVPELLSDLSVGNTNEGIRDIIFCMILPDDFTNRMKEQLGAEYDAFIESYKDPAIKSLRMNRRRVQSGKMRDIAAAVTGKSEPESVFFCVDISANAVYNLNNK